MAISPEQTAPVTPKRGEIWTASGANDYGRKPRPVVILQEDHFDIIDSVTVCGLTTSEMEAPLFRIPVTPTARNGLRSPCTLMADKVATFPKSKLGIRIGRLDDADIRRLNHAVIVFLGLATTPRVRSASEAEPPVTKPPASPEDRA